jgi:nanoRNase/pAp phosphatase (c-di-AMP/oligoRNAs hydrolase)
LKNSLKLFLSKTKAGSKLLIVTHFGADVDAIAAAAALFFALRKRFKIEIAVPDHIGLQAKAFAQNIGIKYSIAPSNISSFDALIIVDLNSFKMLGKMAQQVKAFRKPVLLIDHHEKSREKIASPGLAIVSSEFVSTTELIFDLLKQNKIPLGRQSAASIAAGIITDSAGFLVADHETFGIMAEVLKKSGMPFSGLLSLFQVAEDASEKIAKLKAARRVRIFRLGDFIAVSTTVGCFEADAATILVKIGADIAFAGSEEKGVRISGRASNNFIKKTGFDLAKDVFEKLPGFFGGNGGGHAGAAAYNSDSGGIEAALQKCIALSFDFLKAKGKAAEIREYS